MTFSKNSVIVGFLAILTLAVVALGVFAVTPSVSIDEGGIVAASLVAEGCCGGAGGDGDGDGDGDGGDGDPWTPPPPPPPQPPVCSISSSPSSIGQGDSSTLTWTSSRATSASLTHIGGVAVNGSTSVSPSSSTTYTLTVSGPGGSANCNTTVTVTTPNPVCTLTASPSHVDYYGSTILEWTSSNATSASIDHGIGSVALSGLRSVHNITSNRTYTLTVNGPGGTQTCAASVTVDDQPQTPTCDLHASRTNIRPGESTNLSWSSSNAHSAYLTDFGSVSTSGSRTVYPHHSRTYTLTVHGNGGSRTCSEYINVRTTPPPPPPPTRYPSCTISVSPNSIAQGKTAVLNWNSYNAVSATISQLGGYIPLSGSRVVYPHTTTQYFMTVRNAFGQSATCSTSLGVFTPYRPPVYPIPTVKKYVPVSYVPYTGPEDTAYTLAMVGVLIASLGGAAVLYTRMRRRS